MTQSIELLLDEETEAAVRRAWDALQAAGLPSMADHPGATNRPHVTMGVAHGALGDDVERALHDLADDLPIDLTLGAPLLFGQGGTRILCRLVLPSAELLALHARTAELVPPVRNLGPGKWTPHVTLSSKLPLDDVPLALRLTGDLGRNARAVAVRRWDSDARRTWLLGDPEVEVSADA